MLLLIFPFEIFLDCTAASLQTIISMHVFTHHDHQWELPEPGDMVYLKHFPATRSYVVLRGTILLCKNVLDREGDEVRFSQATVITKVT